MRLRLSDFAGEWTIAREIEQAGAGTARFEGRACFTPEGAGLAYHEAGTLTLPGAAPMRAGRDYLWREEGAEIAVFFSDGRPFHRFDPAAPAAQHWCDPDDYRVRYDFAAWPDWRAEWRVSGPRKAYTMRSLYRRG
ncbi:hypothetical protein DFO80_105106 [Rhodobacter sp. 140A]|nr:hypothetical protein DFO80_105106 [Rhodobacter sp. 140A]